MAEARDRDVKRMIEELGLAPHPEGGYYREMFRSSSTAIYFLLPAGEFSAFHRLRVSDEIWHHYLGDPVELQTISPDGVHQVTILGPDLERGALPGLRLAAQFGERQAVQARLDRQQRERRRLFGVPGEFDRAHRRAPRCRRQDAPAGVGEEDRVDQLGLAARELGDEGDDELLVAEPLAQRADLLGGFAVSEVVLGQEARQVLEPLAERGAPATEGIETGGERWRHQAAQGFGSW